MSTCVFCLADGGEEKYGGLCKPCVDKYDTTEEVKMVAAQSRQLLMKALEDVLVTLERKRINDGDRLVVAKARSVLNKAKAANHKIKSDTW